MIDELEVKRLYWKSFKDESAGRAEWSLNTDTYDWYWSGYRDALREIVIDADMPTDEERLLFEVEDED